MREGVPPVLGDTGRIIQIFHNLIGNSCKFTHNGSISISALLKARVYVCVCVGGGGSACQRLQPEGAGQNTVPAARPAAMFVL